ncbi:MAG: LutC/YkgG family protein [Betaproteobacteria bacterium]
MSNPARDAILGRVRSGIGRSDFTTRRQAAEAAMRRGTPGPQPRLDTDLTARFRQKAEALSSTSETVARSEDVPAAVERYLAQHGLGNALVATSDVTAGYAWSQAGLKVEARPAVDADRVGLTGCFCAIAETGTIMLLSSSDTPASISLLPETHIALVMKERMVGTMEEAFALLRQERGDPPRSVNFISGPSRTGDIEQTIVLGAHGPCRVHLIVVESAA